MSFNIRLKQSVLFLIFLSFSINELNSQNQVADKVSQVLTELIRQSKILDSTIVVENRNEPMPNREQLNTIYYRTVDSIIERKFNPKDSVNIYERQAKLTNKLSNYAKWETKRDQLCNQKNDLDKQIIQYSAIIDLSIKTEEFKNNIIKAEKDNENYKRDVVVSFAATVRMIKEQASSESAYNTLSESMIIFKPGTNDIANDWIQNIMNLLGISGGILAYSNFEKGNNSSGVISTAGVTGIYLIGQMLLTKKKNKDSDITESLEALSRNIIYGNIIRNDSTNLSNLQRDVDSIYNKIEYVNRTDPREVKPDWVPSPKMIESSHILLVELENSLIFWNEIIATSSEMLLKSDNFLTPDGKKNLNNNISKALSVVEVRKDNIERFRSKLIYFDKYYSDKK